MLGQCGPRLLSFKSLFSSFRYWDDASSIHRDRQAELQLVWEEIGDDKCKKLEQLQQSVSAAVHDIYERALEENIRRKTDLEDMVAKSEIHLKELLGPSAFEVMASQDLSLQTRLSINMTQLKAMESVGITEYGWVGGLLVLVKLRHRITAFREMLKLPPCDSADLDEMLARTTEDLSNLCPRNMTLVPLITMSKTKQKPIFQRMHHFYHILCAIEDVWVHSFVTKDAQKMPDIPHFSKSPVRQSSQNDNPLRCSTKRSSSKIKSKAIEYRHAKLCYDEASALDQLTNKILRKLEKINRQTKSAGRPEGENSSPFLTSSWNLSSPSSGHNAPLKELRCKPVSAYLSPNNDATTPTSVLPESSVFTPTPGYYSEDQSETLDTCWAAQYASDLHNRRFREANLDNQSLAASVKTNRLSDLFGSSNELHCGQEIKLTAKTKRLSDLLSADDKLVSNEDITCPPCDRLLITDNEKPSSMSKAHPNPTAHIPPASSTPTPPPPPPPPPPPLPSQPLFSPSAPPPPPPPPPSHLSRGRTSHSSKSTKLRKSPTISRLYLEMKKKTEGVASSQSHCADVAVQRRTTGNGSREGMAEALAEITRRSAYFRKIEDDVHKHAKSILTVKSRLETFETNNMHQLMQFHAEIEAHLEQLTDESQVLARFQGFPIKKLETLRAAASLHFKLTSLVQQIERWSVELPMSDQLEKVNAFFDKVKPDIEAIERTKDEDCQRFSCHKVHFNFETITLIKEAIVGLSSRCLASALAESQRITTNVKMDEYPCIKDMTKMKSSFQMLYKAFLFAFRVHNFAGGHDDRAEQLSSQLALEMEAYPSSFWSELAK